MEDSRFANLENGTPDQNDETRIVHARGTLETMRKLRIPDNLTKLAYKQIRGYLLSGQLEEGGRLTEESVAQQLGISKSPIREAFNRLEAEGLIRIEPRRGAYLRSFSIQEVADIYDFREALEVHTVLTAKITPELIDVLKASVARHASYHAADDKPNYIAEDIQFHGAIAAATGNERLCQALENLQHQLSLLRRKTYDLSSSKAPAAHAALLRALSKQDRAEAQELMRTHIRSTREQLVQYMTTREARPLVISRDLAEAEPSTEPGLRSLTRISRTGEAD